MVVTRRNNIDRLSNNGLLPNLPLNELRDSSLLPIPPLFLHFLIKFSLLGNAGEILGY